MLEFVSVGEDDIWTQVTKLSEETWSDPEQVVSEVLVVTLEEFISSENETNTEVSVDTEETSSLGEIELTTVWILPSMLSSSLE